MMTPQELLAEADRLDMSCYNGGVIEGMNTAQRYQKAIEIRAFVKQQYGVPADSATI